MQLKLTIIRRPKYSSRCEFNQSKYSLKLKSKFKEFILFGGGVVAMQTRILFWDYLWSEIRILCPNHLKCRLELRWYRESRNQSYWYQ